MKAKRAHRVPLSARAVGILREVQALEDESGLVFPSPTGKPLSNMTALEVAEGLKDSGGAAWLPFQLSRLGARVHECTQGCDGSGPCPHHPGQDRGGVCAFRLI